jgi:hypothetical protein
MNAPVNLPISEQWARAAHAHVDAERDAEILAETKSAMFAEMVGKLLVDGMPVNRAETQVKASPEWKRHIEAIVEARYRANKLRVERDYLRMKFSEWVAHDANNRTAARL